MFEECPDAARLERISPIGNRGSKFEVDGVRTNAVSQPDVSASARAHERRLVFPTPGGPRKNADRLRPCNASAKRKRILSISRSRPIKSRPPFVRFADAHRRPPALLVSNRMNQTTLLSEATSTLAIGAVERSGDASQPWRRSALSRAKMAPGSNCVALHLRSSRIAS